MSRRAIVHHDGARGLVGRAYAFFGPFRVQGNAQDALELFWGDWLSEEPDEDLDRVMDSAQVNLAYHSWFVFDFDLGEGRTLLDLFLEREGRNAKRSR